MKSAKAEELPGSHKPCAVRNRSTLVHALAFGATAVLLLFRLYDHLPGLADRAQFTGYTPLGPLPPNINSSVCVQWPPLHPVKHGQLDRELNLYYTSRDFQLLSFMRLGGAVRIPPSTIIALLEKTRWDTFGELHEFLQEEFPIVYQALNVTKVNKYGLVFHWQGSSSAKPYILAAHQDVVPVEPLTADQWKHAPFSGFYDGTWIWGRGSCDDKSNLISQLIAIEALLKTGFRPTRTLVLAFGFDEEAKGTEGAGSIASYLEDTYGLDSFALILDEGGGQVKDGNVIFATPSISEKGYLDVKMEVTTPGGHSSIPPEHTSIGLLSRLVIAIEDNPHKPRLTRTGTPFAATQCLATYSPSFPDDVRALAKKAMSDTSALEQLQDALLRLSPVYKAMLGTTQAVDLIEGGVKVNALPEHAAAVVNHRIAEDSSVTELQRRLIDVVSPVVIKYNMTLEAFEREVVSGDAGRVTLSDAYGTSLEPSPTTPTEYGPWAVLAGSIKATFESSPTYNSSGVVVAPSLSIGKIVSP
ncbi:hypothetical protein F5I97DRAFT_1826792 [Phlebopus sp. FC_14]|nr:hypothetical protein F5I97DRAFT_1826792 [Phlebopus sp. FC_14]